ncbi:MAG: flavin reductase family protein, partial [Limisphaerales bacterium]
MIIDFTQLPPASIYHTMTQTVVPRPIAWVLTSHDNGQ